ncbi:hypothetical protein JHK82_055080 [Glycine max]|nr:hypothetical protein JHK86_054919 [Glycine max]KAG4917609.1 hypothetical protein JHK85_055890 [Glycine max]KAG5073711.1 hypothetical protein JHK84_054942 [Glycine max]KAG5076385.1 hypothetical protein JHK82_055080 [Glycine max]
MYLGNGWYKYYVADNYYRPDLKKAALARLSAVNRSLRVAKSGVKKRNRQAVKLPILHYYHPFPPFVVCVLELKLRFFDFCLERKLLCFQYTTTGTML